MTSRFCFKRTALAGVAGIALMAGSAAAIAQQAKPTAQASARDIEEVVVTGTLIRGVEPVGANVIGLSEDEIKATGAIDANMLLGQLPQSSFFMFMPRPGVVGGFAGTARVPVTQPDIRGLRLAGAPSGSPTLALLDNHRIVPAGLEQSTVDVGVIPPGILAREEIVLDGASAIYGTDAVGGVINYIPRKRFQGGKVDLTYGLGKGDYYETSANVTNGWTWETGGLGLTYSFAKNNNILNGDRPQYAIPRNYFEDRHLTGVQCVGATEVGLGTSIPGTQAAGTAYIPTSATAFRARTASDYCGSNADSDMMPAQTRNSGFADLSQDITDRLRFDMTAFYTNRAVHDITGAFTANLQIRTNNPYYRQLRDANGNLVTGATATSTQTVGINLAAINGYEASYVDTRTEIGQITPSFTYDIGGDWQVNASFVWGKSVVHVDGRILDSDALTNYVCGASTAAGQSCAQRPNTIALVNAINPYDPLATSNPALFSQLDYHDIRDGRHEFAQAIVKADGTLFTIPGGAVKAAVGIDWNKTEFSKAVTNTVSHQIDPRQYVSVNEKAIFAQVHVPIIGPDNAMPGIQSLTFEVSSRYDSYAYYGDTFNPKLALSYEPVDWVTLRGNWGTSFRAPDAADRLGAQFNTARCIGGSGALPPCTSGVQAVPAPFYTGTSAALTATPNVYLLLSGTVNNLKPETSDNWTIGGDIRPPWVDGLTLGASYYSVTFRDHINIANPGVALDNIFNYSPSSYILCMNPDGSLKNGGTGCTQAEYNSFFATTGTSGLGVVNQAVNSGYRILYLMDTRVTNIFGYNIKGLDLNVKYRHLTNWGSFFVNWNGNFQLTNEFKVFAQQAAFTDQLLTGSKFRMSLTAGATYGNFSAQATLQHQSGFAPNPASGVTVATQTGIDQFDVVNMAFRYDMKGTSFLTQDVTVSLNVSNVFDADPPVQRTATGTRARSGDGLRTLGNVGRMFQMGLSKKF